MKDHHTNRVFLGAFGIIFSAAICFYMISGWNNSKWRNNTLEYKEKRRFEEMFADLRIGITPKEAEKAFGRPPDTTSQEIGVLERPNKFLSASAAAGKGPAKLYELHTWSLDDWHATVCFDEDRIAQGKWIYGAGYVNRQRY